MSKTTLGALVCAFKTRDQLGAQKQLPFSLPYSGILNRINPHCCVWNSSLKWDPRYRHTVQGPSTSCN